MMRAADPGQEDGFWSAMSVRTAISRFIDRMDGSVPDPALHFELVRGLYSATSSPKALFSATLAAMAVIATAGMLSGDLSYAGLFVGFLVVGCARSVSVWAFRKAEHDPTDLAATLSWERGAMFGAWAFAGLVGLVGAYSVVFHPGTDV